MTKLTPVEETNKLYEILKKELKYNKLSTSFCVNPAKKVHLVAEKISDPQYQSNMMRPVDDEMLNLAKLHRLPPNRKYPVPITTTQDIGWHIYPLIEIDRKNPLLYFPIKKGEIGFLNELNQSLFVSTKNCRIRAEAEYKIS